jgi:predicted RNA-binding Zn-ribbon protein involved in translation (DUF1610 family)
MKETHFRYSLDTQSRKFPCPECGKNRFVRYVDTHTGEHVGEGVGRCDREQSCGYHLTPRTYGEQTGTTLAHHVGHVNTVPKSRPIHTHGRIPFHHVDARLNRYEHNQLVVWLATLPGWHQRLAAETAQQYFLGTGGKGSRVDGWPIFWQIDNKGQVRSGKLIRYDPDRGKRIKDNGFNYTWVHSQMIDAGLLPDDKSKWTLEQCLFGLHLVTPDESRPIAIVEGEKTALIASQYFPKFVWLSCGQLNGLSTAKLKPLIGRKIVLFPDKGVFTKWQERAKELATVHTITVADLLEVYAPSEHDGYDIADYLAEYDIREFPESTQYAKFGLNPYTGEVFDQRGHPADWDTVEPPERGTPEYDEITLLVMREMDAEIIPDADPSKIDQFWQEVSHKQKDWRVRVYDDD